MQSVPPDDVRDIFEVGQVLSDTYEIRAVIGAGGMGQVFEAHDLLLHRKVAIKAAWPELRDSPVRKEAQALAAIRHPGLVQVYAAGTHDGVEYVVMERVVGVSLDTHLERRASQGERLEITEALDLLIPITDALVAVHGAGIAHRDIKPGNVMLATGGRVVLMDLGLFLPEFDVAAQVTIAGSPQYMSPEAITNSVEPGAGGLVDLYALGVVAFELLTGQPPFAGATPEEVWDRHLYDPVPDPGALRVETPAELSRLVTELLSKDPGQRPQSAEAALFRLRAIRAQVATQPREAQLSVLVVDDDKDLAKILSFYVKKAAPSAEIRVAANGEAAIAAIREREPHLLLLDLHMPKMSGVEVCMYLRGEGVAEHMSIAVVSAGAQEEDRSLLGTLGIHRFIQKGDGLAAAVATLVKEERARRAGERRG
ncbi:MAG: protein kinase [Polyangiaceae bacterium]|nr:protein kinase [Polyangiaceae bacterium]